MMQSHLHEVDGSHYVTGGGQTAECKPVDTSTSSSSAAYYLNTLDVSSDIKHSESGITTATNTTLGGDCSLGPMNMTAEDSSMISADLYKNSTDHLSGQGALLADCDTVTTNLASASSGVVENRSAAPSSVTSQLSAIRSSNPNDESSSSRRSERAHPHHSNNNSQLDIEDPLSQSIVRQTEERVGGSGMEGHEAYQEEGSQRVGGAGPTATHGQYQSHHQEMMMNELLRMQHHRGEAEVAFSRSHSHSQPKPQHSAASNGREQPLMESTSSDTQLIAPTTTTVTASQTPQHISQLSSPQEQSEDPRPTLGNNPLPANFLLDSFLVSSLSPCLNAKKRTQLHVALSSNAQCEVAVLANRNLNGIDSNSNGSGRSSAHLIHRTRHPKSSQFLSRSVDGLTFFSSNPPLNEQSPDPNRFFIAQPSSKALAATKHIVTYFHSREEEEGEGDEEREGNANESSEGDGHSDPHTDAEYAYLRPNSGNNSSGQPFISKREPFNFQQQLAPNQIVYSYDGTSPFWSQKPFWFHTVMIDHIQRTVDYQQDLAGGWQRWKVGSLSGMERSVIVNSVDEVCAFLRVSRAGFYAAVSLLDTFLSVCEAPTGNASPNEDLLDANNFRCLIIAAVYISSKLHDIAPPHIRKVIEALGVPVSPEVICGMEYRLISTMHFCTHPLALNDVMAYFSHFPLRPSREYMVQRWKDVTLKKANANGSSTTFTSGTSMVAGACSSSNVGGQSRNGATATSDTAASPSAFQQQLSAAGAVSPPPFVPDYTAPLPLPIMDSLRSNLRNVLAILSDVVIRSSIMIQAPTLLIGAVLFKTALTISDYAEIVNFDEDDDGYDVEEDGINAELIDVDSLLAPPNANEPLSLPTIMEHIKKYTNQLGHFRARSLGSGGFVGFLARAVRGLLGTVNLPVPPMEELVAFYEARCAGRQRTAIERANKVVTIQRNVQELSRVLSEEVRYRVRRLDAEEQARREQQQKERDNERERARARTAAREGSSCLRSPQQHVDPTVVTAAVCSAGFVLDDNDDNSNMLGFGFGGHESEGQHNNNNPANSITSTSATTNDDDDFNTNSPAKAHRPQPMHSNTNNDSTTTNNGERKGTDFETVDFHPYEVARRRAAATSRERRGGDGKVAGGTQRDEDEDEEEQKEGAEDISNNEQKQQTMVPSGFFGEGLDDATVLFPPEGVHMKGGGTPPIACVETDATATRSNTTHFASTQKMNPSPLPSLLTSVVTSAKNQTSNMGDPTAANVIVSFPLAATTVETVDSNNFSNSDTVNEPVSVNGPDDTDTYGQASRRAERAELAAYTQALYDVAAETTARVDQLLAFEEEGFDVGTVAVQYYLQRCEAEIIAACSSVFSAGRSGGSSSAHHHQGWNSSSNSQSLNQSTNNALGGSLGGSSSSRQHQLASVSIPPTVPPILVSRYGEQLVKSIIIWFEKYHDRTALQAHLEQLHQQQQQLQ